MARTIHGALFSAVAARWPSSAARADPRNAQELRDPAMPIYEEIAVSVVRRGHMTHARRYRPVACRCRARARCAGADVCRPAVLDLLHLCRVGRDG